MRTSMAPGSRSSVAVVLVAWLALCLAYYYCPVYGGVYWFQGPVSNIAGESHMAQEQGGSGLPVLDDLKEDSIDTVIQKERRDSSRT